jgi:hypothetical protein
MKQNPIPMKTHRSSILSVAKCAALAAVFLVGTAVPSYASNTSATPIGAGQATGGPSPEAPGQAASVALQFYLVQLPDGSLNGKATLTSADGSVQVKLKSYAFKDGALCAEGLITSLTGTPRFGPGFFFPDGNQVGDTIFFQVYDLGNGHQSDAFIEGALPSWFGSPDMNTIIAILAHALGGDGVAPAEFCRQVVHGNFEVLNLN